MSATPINTRSELSKKIEDYVLTYESGPESRLFSIDSRDMISDSNVTQPCETGLLSPIDIGFSFVFNDVSYSRCLISSDGYIALLDPAAGNSWSTSDYLLPDGALFNAGLKTSFSHNHVILSPWWDHLTNCAKYITDPFPASNLVFSIPPFPPFILDYGVVDSYLYALGLTRKDLSGGKTSYPIGIDSTSGGIKYIRGSNSQGRYFVVRWKSFSSAFDFTYSSLSPSGPCNVVAFDVVIYENGTIEFRYSPTNNRGVDAFESATVGVFLSCSRYRDFGHLLKNDVRNQHVNGGADGTSSYSDAFPAGATGSGLKSAAAAPYTISLNTTLNWPGQKLFGAIFRFSPPVRRRRQNRSIVSLRDSVPFVQRSTSYFDDRSMATTNAQVVEYPSMLPVYVKTSNDSSVPQATTELFQSGSITLKRDVSPGLYESLLFDSYVDSINRRNR